MNIQLSISPSHSILTPGRPVPALALERQASGKGSHWSTNFKSLVSLDPEKSCRKRDSNSGPSTFGADALPLGPLDGQRGHPAPLPPPPPPRSFITARTTRRVLTNGRSEGGPPSALREASHGQPLFVTPTNGDLGTQASFHTGVSSTADDDDDNSDGGGGGDDYDDGMMMMLLRTINVIITKKKW